MHLHNTSSTGLTITNPLVLYRALLATHRILPDPSQHRLALHLQMLYEKLIDYEPTLEYSHRLNQLSRAVGGHNAPSTPFNPAKTGPRGIWSSLLAQKEKRHSLALTRVLTSHEAALQLNSPKALMLHGEVGTGKSMLIDLFADSRDMIQPSPILFLDEFQLPDRAASKIMSNLMIGFFQLGGVLITTSNRMPDELAKAAGIDFPPSSRLESLGWRFGTRGASGTDSQHGEFATFLEVLKARRDEQKNQDKSIPNETSTAQLSNLQHISSPTATDLSEADAQPPATSTTPSTSLPKHYILENFSTNPLSPWLNTPWTPSSILVYGRTVPIPRQLSGTTLWTFSELCGTNLEPADYITLAAIYHTIIQTSIPILTIFQKNEARRLITLLDALYEAQCKLVITAAADLDVDTIYPETFSEAYQDATFPFRPNIASYNPASSYTHTLFPDAFGDDPPDRAGVSFTDERRFGPAPDFNCTAAFTGEDERFAYKRATSRIWEMCSARLHERSGEGWWKPLGANVRRWEGGSPSDMSSAVSEGESRVVGEGKYEELFRYDTSPFRTATEPPPKIGWTHDWGTARWGKRAGVWGRGVEGLEERMKGNGKGKEKRVGQGGGEDKDDR
ncbi:hypothetical protein K432DRAFT_418228 [Lepidopterella palustris CBS 459.81]|uniref:AAA+ ATPase domain-containing protein n=1 Tax=Lepidopterella palustris CBS 459.81 TaxID=1314670 RepID=A0A8E2JD62_9PEZI|nr:hypothetical protein K432DRAFT_418228 [Lepidopterella palustris CBS 459.81]